MTKAKDTNKANTTQGVVLEIDKKVLPDKITYQVEELKDFIKFVFEPEGLLPDENVLVWKTSGMVPGYPAKSVASFFATLERSKKPAKLYFGTSTTVRAPDGELRNQKALFKSFYVLVLDDIGTKVPKDKIPENFTPSYIIETSPGNFQYGYVLDEPITVREEAETLVQLVYDAGYSDGGGKMATKLVRLPGGVNGKVGENRDFKVKLIEKNEDVLWSPNEILDALNIGVDWNDVVADADKVMKERAGSGAGASPWSPVKPELGSLNGVVDDVAEWLYDTGQVKQETPEWLAVKCPWSDTHTDGNDWASYSPMGWGGPEWVNRRSFHCFHDHCRSKHSDDFLEFVHNAGGPDAPVSERAFGLTSRYVFDPVNKGVWDIKQERQPIFIAIDAFNYLHPFKVSIPSAKTKVAETALFKLAKSRVDAYGMTYDPTTPAKLVTQHGVQQINLYTQPDWGDGDYVKSDVKMFKDFIKYLIPEKAAREFFLDWLAAKTQSMAFRGPAILMIAPSQGTGRTTLANMMSTMFGRENLERVPFERLSQGGGDFNDWITKPIIVTDETLALGNEDNFYKVYERLKELIDTTPQEVRVNPKFGKQRFQTTYSSFVLFSNHDNAMKVAHNDRRIYVLDNVDTPASPEYFVKLHEWLDAGRWAKSVWRWLRKRDIDIGKLVAPPAKTRAKDDMIKASKQPLEVAIEALLDSWPTNLISFFQAREIIDSQQFKPRYHLLDDKRFDLQIQRIFKNHTKKLTDVGKQRIGDKIALLKYISSRGGPAQFSHDHVVHELTEDQREAIKVGINEALDEHDF